jgi:transposase
MGAKSRPPYPAAFRAEAVQLVRGGGRSLIQAAKDLGVHHETLRAWVKQAEIDGGRRDGLTTEERTELARLRREVRGNDRRGRRVEREGAGGGAPNS